MVCSNGKAKDEEGRDQRVGVPGEGLEDTQGGEVCSRFRDYISPEEGKILAILREKKQQVRAIKKRIQQLASELDWSLWNRAEVDLTPQEREKLEAQREIFEQWEHCKDQLEQLRVTWRRWKERLDKANREKMIRLGHLSE